MYIECAYVGFIDEKFRLSNTEIRLAVSRKGLADRNTGTCGEKRRNMRTEAQEHEDRSAGTCRKKRRNMRTEAQEHEERRAGTCGEKHKSSLLCVYSLSLKQGRQLETVDPISRVRRILKTV
jgi:hypothetical protein